MINIVIAEKGYNFSLVSHDDLTSKFINKHGAIEYILDVESEINDDGLYIPKRMVLIKTFPCKFGIDREFIMSATFSNMNVMLKILSENLDSLLK